MITDLCNSEYLVELSCPVYLFGLCFPEALSELRFPGLLSEMYPALLFPEHLMQKSGNIESF